MTRVAFFPVAFNHTAVIFTPSGYQSLFRQRKNMDERLATVTSELLIS